VKQLDVSEEDSDAFETRLKARARELGFAACGIARVEVSETHPHFVQWLENGFHADMNWIAREDAVRKRRDVREIMPTAKSVICVAMHYRTEDSWDASTHGEVARYARGTDYHEFMPQRLRALLSWIQQSHDCQGRVYVDTGPVLEREWAQRAGLGWIGKNTMLMSRELGSYFLLGEIIVDLELEPDAPHVAEYCGSCTRCLDACPTDAFVAPRELDAKRCISYQTIENRQEIPEALAIKFGDWIFGCDICQQVCPWNAKSTHLSGEPELWRRDQARTIPDLLAWLMLPQEEFSHRLSKSPLKRPKLAGMKRNAATAQKNRAA
jgi:epoxyqueuosine reductase